ncbi:hypothetical protein BH23PLA1_BH23PLA1_16680 [soil metagenome]
MTLNIPERTEEGPRPAPTPLDIVGQLMLTFDRGEVRVDFRHDTIDIELPDLRAGFTLLRQFPWKVRREQLHKLQSTLAQAGLALQIWVGRDPVGRLSGGSNPGFASRLLRIDPIEIRTSDLIRLLLSRRRGSDPA